MKKIIRIQILVIITALVILLVACSTGPFGAKHSGNGTNSSSDKITDGNKGTMILKNCTIIDGKGSEPIKNSTITIKDGRIESIRESGNTSATGDATVIDLKGYTVLPGLINAHVHRSYNKANLRRWLKAGITTVRDLAPFTGPDYLSQRDGFNKDLGNARIVSANPILSPPGGYYAGIYVESPKDAENKVKELVKQGVDIIKISVEDDCQGRIWPVLLLDEAKAIVNTAHSLNKKVSAHITHVRNLQTAIDAGIDDIAHMVVEPLDETLINEIIKKNIYWIPTLELWHGVSEMHSLDYENVAVDNLSRFYKAGGKVALGTDYSGYSFEFDKGFPITEVKLMQKAGMSNMDIIIAATSNAAFVCDMEQEAGTLEKGKAADIMVVKNNPLENIEALLDPYMVIHGGEIAYKK